MSSIKKSSILLILLALLLIGAFGAYKYAYQAHETTESRAADFTGSSADFLNKIKSAPDAWVNKAVVLKGKVTGTDKSGITLNSSIYCQLREDAAVAGLTKGKEVEIKGRVIGYDDLMEELKLDQVILLK